MDNYIIEDYKKEKSLLKKILIKTVSYLLLIIISVGVSLAIRSYVFEVVIVSGSSMEDTLFNDQKLLLNKIKYEFKKPERGDIIVLERKEDSGLLYRIMSKIKFLEEYVNYNEGVYYIKRVIGIPGDIVDIRDNNVFVNGEIIEEDYIKGKTNPKGEYPKTVPVDNYFVMGDNREHSSDSRNIGFIDIDKIKGKAVVKEKAKEETKEE
jgi:signal peptidase I